MYPECKLEFLSDSCDPKYQSKCKGSTPSVTECAPGTSSESKCDPGNPSVNLSIPLKPPIWRYPLDLECVSEYGPRTILSELQDTE